MRLIEHGGDSLPVSAWSKKTGVPISTIVSRIDRLGWSVERALTTPTDKRFRTVVQRMGNRPVPRLREHHTGQAYVRWSENGRTHDRYFGPWGSAQANEGYAKFVSAWARGEAEIKQVPKPRPGECSFAQLCVSYIHYAGGYYVKAGRRTSEYHCIRLVLREAVQSLGDRRHMPACEFTPDDLRAIVGRFVARGNARKSINTHQFRIVKMFKWAAVEGHVGYELPGRLAMVPKIRRGQTTAREWRKKNPIPWGDVVATFPHLWPENEPRRAVVEALIRAHWFMGCRPSAICSMQPKHLDRSRDVWRYQVPDEVNKNAHRDQELVVFIGPKAQEIIAPLLIGCPPDRAIFSLPPKSKGSTWTELTRELYGKIVKAAIRRAAVTSWTPHQMRHTRATEVRRAYESSADAAKAIGDTPDVAEAVYTDTGGDDRPAERIARELG